jgi:hypothetical protein
VPGAGVVFLDVEKQPVCAERTECCADNLVNDTSAQAALGTATTILFNSMERESSFRPRGITYASMAPVSSSLT